MTNECLSMSMQLFQVLFKIASDEQWWGSSCLIMSFHAVLAVLHDHLSPKICSIDMNVVEKNSIMSLSECFHLIIVC